MEISNVKKIKYDHIDGHIYAVVTGGGQSDYRRGLLITGIFSEKQSKKFTNEMRKRHKTVSSNLTTDEILRDLQSIARTINRIALDKN